MSEITTEYIHGTYCSRIVADCEGHKYTAFWAEKLTMEENHVRAARHLLEDLDSRQGSFTTDRISHLKCLHTLV